MLDWLVSTHPSTTEDQKFSTIDYSCAKSAPRIARISGSNPVVTCYVHPAWQRGRYETNQFCSQRCLSHNKNKIASTSSE